MNAFKFALAAAAVALGSGAALADAKVPAQYPVSTERGSVDQVGVGRLVESRAATTDAVRATRRGAVDGLESAHARFLFSRGATSTYGN